MKLFKKITKAGIALLMLSLILTSCAKDEVSETPITTNDTSEIKKSSEVDKATDAMDDIALRVFEKQERGEEGGFPADFSYLPNCVTVTVVYEQNFREITIDFGSDGCEVNGNILTGKIIMSYERNPSEQQRFISKSLENFYFNSKNIVGSKTILKEKFNANGNPQYTQTLDLTVIWPNEDQASRSGTKIKEWVAGYDTDFYSDNVFEITGNWSSTFVNGSTRNYEVISPLRREVICDFFVSGSIDVDKPNASGVLDYGSGDCDNMATFTNDDGETFEIVLN